MPDLPAGFRHGHRRSVPAELRKPSAQALPDRHRLEHWSRRWSLYRTPWLQPVAISGKCARPEHGGNNGKEGSTVRVRQRALQKRRTSARSRSDRLAESAACGGYGAVHGAFALAGRLTPSAISSLTPSYGERHARNRRHCGHPRARRPGDPLAHRTQRMVSFASSDARRPRHRAPAQGLDARSHWPGRSRGRSKTHPRPAKRRTRPRPSRQTRRRRPRGGRSPRR